MRPSRRRAAISLAGAVALGVAGAAVATGANATGAKTSTATGTKAAAWSRACDTPAPGMAACHALHVNNVPQHIRALGVTPNATPSGFGPADLLSAYNLPAGGGAGQTVAIVDAYNDPSAEADMNTYRAQYGLPACTSASGCFKQVNQKGGSRLPRSDSGWAGEISLDLDMVSAIAPNAHIILVEASTASMTNLGTAVNTAVSLGAKFVSNSYGGGESSADTSYDTTYFKHPGVAITASSGDSGYGVEYPAASPYVTSVGGTALKKDSSTARGWSESVWSTSSTEGAGSGCSAYDSKPSWQKDTGCAKRTVADVSAVADPATGVAVYQTYGGSGWAVYGGTSVAAPLIAAVYADAGAPTASVPAANLYSHTSALNDVTSGATASCSPSYLCAAKTGYDGPTGLGTPNGLAAFTG
ncbi:MAG: peptidase S8 [Catenulispora sp.]|nr:peptidase S8 [Catenulispora sp.]